MHLGNVLEGISRCPHCGIANPQLVQLWNSDGLVVRHTPGPRSRWGAYVCTSCGNVVTAKGRPGSDVINVVVETIFPAPKEVHKDIPAVARKFLQQAYETLHAPDAAAVMAGSAVDAMLKALDYTEGTLYSRIDEAVADHVLTQNMGDWAHSVRLDSNRPRHSDQERPHLTDVEAKNSVDFAEALATFLFVLRARIEKGIEDAGEAAKE